jgi:hypothetical protein
VDKFSSHPSPPKKTKKGNDRKLDRADRSQVTENTLSFPLSGNQCANTNVFTAITVRPFFYLKQLFRQRSVSISVGPTEYAPPENGDKLPKSCVLNKRQIDE